MGRAARRWKLQKRTLDGMEPRRDNIILKRARGGNINGGDRIVVEATQPARYAGSDHDPLTAAFHRGCATSFPAPPEWIARLFARASTELTRIKARRLDPTSSGIDRSDLDRSTGRLPDYGRAVVSPDSFERRSLWVCWLARSS